MSKRLAKQQHQTKLMRYSNKQQVQTEHVLMNGMSFSTESQLTDAFNSS